MAADGCPMAANGRHGAPPRHRGIKQSADMLRNRSQSFKKKIEKPILITINLTSMCTMHQQRPCGCM